MFKVTKSSDSGRFSAANFGTYNTKDEAEKAAFSLIEANLGPKVQYYIEDDPDYPGCTDIFAWAGSMSIVVSINTGTIP